MNHKCPFLFLKKYCSNRAMYKGQKTKPFCSHPDCNDCEHYKELFKEINKVSPQPSKRPRRTFLQGSKTTFPRPCSRCGKIFQPLGKYHKICSECSKK